MSFTITDVAFAGKTKSARERLNRSGKAVTARAHKSSFRAGKSTENYSSVSKHTGAKKESSGSKVRKVTKSVLRTVSDLTKTVRKKKELMSSDVVAQEDGSDKGSVLTEMDDGSERKALSTSELPATYTSEDVELASKLTGEMTYATRILSSQPAVLQLTGNTAVIGDIHGDYISLNKIIKYLTPKLERGEIKNVVFLGDYIDRGPSSAKTLLALLQFHREYPNRVYLLRGNHETVEVYNKMSGVAGMASAETPIKLMGNELMFSFFHNLPYAAIINNETLAVHGGIPRRDLWRKFWIFDKVFETSADFKAICTALWSDFSEDGNAMDMNLSRGRDPLAVCYNERCVSDFLMLSNEILRLKFLIKDINLKNIIRGHQPLESITFQSKNKLVTTVFSAINGQYILGIAPQIALVRAGSPPELLKMIR